MAAQNPEEFYRQSPMYSPMAIAYPEAFSLVNPLPEMQTLAPMQYSTMPSPMLCSPGEPYRSPSAGPSPPLSYPASPSPNELLHNTYPHWGSPNNNNNNFSGVFTGAQNTLHNSEGEISQDLTVTLSELHMKQEMNSPARLEANQDYANHMSPPYVFEQSLQTDLYQPLPPPYRPPEITQGPENSGLYYTNSQVNIANIDSTDLQNILEISTESLFDPSKTPIYEPENKLPELPSDPREWQRDPHIRQWLRWAKSHEALNLVRHLKAEFLPPTGAELCSLSKERILLRVGPTDLNKIVDFLNNRLAVHGATLPEETAKNPYEFYYDSCNRLSRPGSAQIQLWQFLLEELMTPINAKVIAWENFEGMFVINDPDELARKWGRRKNKPEMNYDKMSRAMRYYYGKQMMHKVEGKRYAYIFKFYELEEQLGKTKGIEKNGDSANIVGPFLDNLYASAQY